MINRRVRKKIFQAIEDSRSKFWASYQTQRPVPGYAPGVSQNIRSWFDDLKLSRAYSIQGRLRYAYGIAKLNALAGPRGKLP